MFHIHSAAETELREVTARWLLTGAESISHDMCARHFCDLLVALFNTQDAADLYAEG